MANNKHPRLIENVLILVLIGIVAGAAGGLAVGVISLHSASLSSSSSH